MKIPRPAYFSTLILIISLLSCRITLSQTAVGFGDIYDSACIYAWTFDKRPVVEPMLIAAYVREKPDMKVMLYRYHVSSSFRDLESMLDTTLLYSATEKSFQRCHLVIDFISGDRTAKSIMIDEQYRYTLIEHGSNGLCPVFKSTKKLVCYLNTLFPLIRAKYYKLDCD
jgi:hypothetical protein